MTLPSEKIESGGARPRVCVCGYNLAGLPDTSNMRCPECGAAIGPGVVDGRTIRQRKRLTLLAYSPPIAAFVLGPLVAVLVMLTGPLILVEVAVASWVVFWILSIIAAVTLTWERARQRSEEAQFMASFGVFLGALIGYPIASILAAMLGWLLLELIAGVWSWVNGG